MKDQRKMKVRARGFQVNTKQRATNEQEEGKECEARRQEVENTKTAKCEKIYEIGLEIHEVARGKGPL